jgi:hypothetical protein
MQKSEVRMQKLEVRMKKYGFLASALRLCDFG